VRIVIAGAGGQLGRSLQVSLRRHDLEPLTRPDLDVTNLTQVRECLATHKPEVVINASAYNDVDGAESDPDAAFRLNAVGPRNLALAAASIHAAILHLSTDYVFDGEAARPYHEFDRPNPQSVYGKSKLAGELAVVSLNAAHYIVRTSWLYKEEGRNFPNKILRLAAAGQVRVVNDQIGSPTYAPHLAAAIAQLVETRAYGTYHLAGRGSTSWYELAKAICRELGIAAQILPVSTAEFPRPAQRPRYSALTTIQEPHIVLPSWKQGVRDFARAQKPDS
jgi:dTDP-4-dehydrorhamnose reductase